MDYFSEIFLPIPHSLNSPFFDYIEKKVDPKSSVGFMDKFWRFSII